MFVCCCISQQEATVVCLLVRSPPSSSTTLLYGLWVENVLLAHARAPTAFMRLFDIYVLASSAGFEDTVRTGGRTDGRAMSAEYLPRGEEKAGKCAYLASLSLSPPSLRARAPTHNMALSNS